MNKPDFAQFMELMTAEYVAAISQAAAESAAAMELTQEEKLLSVASMISVTILSSYHEWLMENLD